MPSSLLERSWFKLSKPPASPFGAIGPRSKSREELWSEVTPGDEFPRLRICMQLDAGRDPIRITVSLA